MSEDIVIIGAGPAGLATGYELAKQGRPAVILEKDAIVGGLARTVEYKGFRCDIGGHRFFTKSDYVDALWREVLGSEFLRRPRLSRIYYDGKFFAYPLRISNVVRNLGLIRSCAILGSLLAAKISPRKPEASFEDWVSTRFGRRLFEMFFRTYTEKVWGIPCSDLSSDWAAQRIRNLSGMKAITNALGLQRKRSVASLIDEFDYPRLGPGQMYESMAEGITTQGGTIKSRSKVTRIEHSGGKTKCVSTSSEGAGPQQYAAETACFSSAPLDELALSLSPAPPSEVVNAARQLTYRSIITVNLLLDQIDVAPDTCIYIHDPSVRASRVQLYKNWSPYMVPDPEKSVVGMEYFCTESDAMWTKSDQELLEIATNDLEAIGLADTEAVFDVFCARYPKAYPVYRRDGYRRQLETIRGYLETITNLYPIGRYGQFRYNNMDHSILTGVYSVRKFNGEDIDPWSVNVEQEHLEER